MAGRRFQILLVAALAVAYGAPTWQLLYKICLVALSSACVWFTHDLWMAGATCSRKADVTAQSEEVNKDIAHSEGRTLLETKCTIAANCKESCTGLTMAALAKHDQTMRRARQRSPDSASATNTGDDVGDDHRSEIIPATQFRNPCLADNDIPKHRTLMARSIKHLHEDRCIPPSACAFNQVGFARPAFLEDNEFPQQRSRFGANEEEPDEHHEDAEQGDMDMMSEITSVCMRTDIGFAPAFLPMSSGLRSSKTSPFAAASKSQDTSDVLDNMSKISACARTEIGFSPAMLSSRHAPSKFLKPSAFAAERKSQVAERNSQAPSILTLEMLVQHNNQF